MSLLAEIAMPRTTASGTHENLYFENGATIELSHSATVTNNIKVKLVLTAVYVGEFY